MTDSEAVVELPQAEPARIAAAVEAAVNARASSSQWIREGAEHSAHAESAGDEQARRFQTLLEIGYLVASADGFAEEERASLALLLEHVTADAIDHEVLELHFKDLDEAVALLGRRERLARSAADLADHAAAEETISLVAMIAMADGVLSAEENAVLVTLGQHVDLGADRVDSLVREAAQRVLEGLQ